MTIEPPDNQTSMSRKDFVEYGLGWLKTNLVKAVIPALEAPLSEQSVSLRPPGAMAEPELLSHCIPFCKACQEACPKEAITTDSFGFPKIEPDHNPCVMCTDVPCTQVCPTSALTPLNDPKTIHLGTALIELTVCTAYHGSGCTVCYQMCPLPNQAIVLDQQLPMIQADQCTGCGVCVWACPTPDAIFIKPQEHQRFKLALSS